MLMCMLGKLSKDWKEDWLKHLPEVVHAYNYTWLAITGYSPHYLMFGCWLHLPIDLYFSTIRGMKKHQHVDNYVAELCEWLWEAFKEAQVQSTSEAVRQKWYYDRKANAISLESGDFVLAEANAYRGRVKVKDWWEEELYEVECQVEEGIPSYLVKNQWTGCSWVLHQHWLFLITLTEETHLCMVVQVKQARSANITLDEQTLEGSETVEVPQGGNCPLLAQHQTGETSLGQVNRKLHALMWMFLGASWLDKGWKVQCRGIGGV